VAIMASYVPCLFRKRGPAVGAVWSARIGTSQCHCQVWTIQAPPARATWAFPAVTTTDALSRAMSNPAAMPPAG